MSQYKIKPLKNTNLLDKLRSEVDQDYYRLYFTSEVPQEFQINIKYPHSHCVVVITASVPKPDFTINQIKPQGVIYSINYYRDDKDYLYGQHFNKDSRLIFTDNKEETYSMHFKDNKHLIDAVATGTSLPFLINKCNLPSKKYGKISELCLPYG